MVLRFILLILFLNLAVLANTFAQDKIILKSGKTVEGRIIERTDKYVKIDFCGIELKYYLDQIEDVITQKEMRLSKPDGQGLPSPKVVARKTFLDEVWGYSLEYPDDWSVMPREELKGVMLFGIRPAEDFLVSLQLQAGSFSPFHVKGVSGLADLLETCLKPSLELKREFIKPVNLKYLSGYLLRYTYKTVEVISLGPGGEGNIYLPIKVNLDYYFFSPLFSSGGNDRRAFLIELTSVEFDEPTAEVDSFKNRAKCYQINNYLKERNRKLKEKYWQAQEIVNSFVIKENV